MLLEISFFNIRKKIINPGRVQLSGCLCRRLLVDLECLKRLETSAQAFPLQSAAGFRDQGLPQARVDGGLGWLNEPWVVPGSQRNKRTWIW